MSSFWERRNLNISICLMIIKSRSRGSMGNTMLVIFKNSYFRFLSYPMATVFCKHPVGVSSIGSRSLAHRFLIPLSLTFVPSSFTGRTRPHCWFRPIVSGFQELATEGGIAAIRGGMFTGFSAVMRCQTLKKDSAAVSSN
jgi:hypothetical protein